VQRPFTIQILRIVLEIRGEIVSWHGMWLSGSAYRGVGRMIKEIFGWRSWSLDERDRYVLVSVYLWEGDVEIR
jgi:hypothetical protein